MNLWKRIRHQFRPVFRALRRSLRPPDYRTLLKRVDALERNVHNALLGRYAELRPGVDPRELLRSREFKATSQNGEDGLLLHIFSLVGTPPIAASWSSASATERSVTART